MLTLSQIKGVGDATIKKLQELDIRSVFELFSFLPTKYIDLQSPVAVGEAEVGALTLLEGRVDKISAVSPRGTRAFSVTFIDTLSTNSLSTNGQTSAISSDSLYFNSLSANKLAVSKFKATFFNMPFLHDNFQIGDEYRLFGRLTLDKNTYTVANPKLEKKEKISKLKDIYTVYPLKGILGQNTFKNIMQNALSAVDASAFEGRLAKINADIIDVFCRLHAPNTLDEAEDARDGLASLDMAIVLSMYRKLRNSTQKERKVFYNFNNFRIVDFINALPFAPTASQTAAFEDIFADMQSAKNMSRIISGDVGSGKTAVAFFAMVACVKGGRQCALMAPTEILAKQHFKKFAPLADKLGISFALLTSSTSAVEKRKILSGLSEGSIDCVIGTQSLISDGVDFKRLSLAVIDEQHKFGVNERRILESKGAVDVLSLTATPIPRSMALTFYDDIDISLIKKRESAMSNITTTIVSTVDEGVKNILNSCKAGKQAFIVCPSIVDAEGYDVMSIEAFIRSYGSHFDGIKMQVLHGKMSDEDKTNAMRAFAAGETQVLIATTVVEVGIDTLASDILVLGADRFGLASLHQLRGRVGRDGSEAHCYVHLGSASARAMDRLSLFCAHNDGQFLAEADFAMRGAGDFIGTRQSGASLTPIFGLKCTAETLTGAKEYADKYLGGLSLQELSALTRRSKSKVEAFLSELNKVTLNS